MNNINENHSLIQYPCEFPIKIIGHNKNEFINEIYLIIKKFDDGFSISSIRSKISKSENYIGLTVNVFVKSQEQLDNLYKELSNHPLSSFVL